MIRGEFSNWRDYVANTVGGATSGLVAITTKNIWAASAANSAVSIGLKKLLCGEKLNWTDLGQFVEDTIIGGLAGKAAGKLVPRGPGREPTRFWSSLKGQIGVNTLWRQGGIQTIIELVEKGILEGFNKYHL